MENDWKIIVNGTNKFNKIITLITNTRPMPQPRQNYKSRHYDPAAKKYNEWRKGIRDSLRISWNQRFTGLLDGSLVASFSFGATKSAPMDARRKKDGSIDKRSVRSIYDYDINNLIKATEDIMNGIVYGDDKLIREYGPCQATDKSKDYIIIKLQSVKGPLLEE
jgi:Holliday junction resolvase RusA-like endonuclease